MNKVMMAWMILFGTIAYGTQAYAVGGREGGNGSFAFPLALERLRTASRELEDRLLHSLSDEDFDRISGLPGKKAQLVQVIRYENLIQAPTEYRSSNGKQLQLDYDPVSWQLTVLEPFYAAYNVPMPDFYSSMNTKTNLAIEGILLHEAAHLFGLNEADAERFAQSILPGIASPDDDLRFLPINEVAGSSAARAINVAENTGGHLLRCDIDFNSVVPGKAAFCTTVTIVLAPGSTQIADPFFDFGRGYNPEFNQDHRLHFNSTDYIERNGGPNGIGITREQIESHRYTDQYIRDLVIRCRYLN